jgi:hypothetical protein
MKLPRLLCCGLCLWMGIGELHTVGQAPQPQAWRDFLRTVHAGGHDGGSGEHGSGCAGEAGAAILSRCGAGGAG